MKQKGPSLTIWKDPEALSIAAAHFFVAACERYVAEKDRFTVALSGGNTPARLYQLLASPAFSNNIPWKKVFLFWSDERLVPYTSPDSNYRLAKENLLDHIPIPKKNIFPTSVTPNAQKAAAQYDHAIRRFFLLRKPSLDWILLGTGPDGHTASLFPGTDILDEKRKLVREVWVEKKQSWRISFTYPMIHKAKEVVVLASGKEKAPVIAQWVRNKKPFLPVQRVNPSGVVRLLIDRDAASGL